MRGSGDYARKFTEKVRRQITMAFALPKGLMFKTTERPGDRVFYDQAQSCWFARSKCGLKPAVRCEVVGDVVHADSELDEQSALLILENTEAKEIQTPLRIWGITVHRDGPRASSLPQIEYKHEFRPFTRFGNIVQVKREEIEE